MLKALSILGLSSVIMLVGCASPEQRKAEAEAEYAEQKAEILQDYRRCVKNAGDDSQKLDVCERLLKAVQ